MKLNTALDILTLWEEKHDHFYFVRNGQKIVSIAHNDSHIEMTKDNGDKSAILASSELEVVGNVIKSKAIGFEILSVYRPVILQNLA